MYKVANVISEELLEGMDELITGIDSGNTSTKVSFLTDEGFIESFTIPTVMAPAGSTVLDEMDYSNLGKGEYELQGEDRLHVHIKSNALPNNKKSSFYFVGLYAIDKEEMKQPEIGKEKHDSELHTVTTLTGLAVAAVKANKSQVKINYSGGLPIEEYKKVGQQALTKLIGEHKVEFLDGPFAGKKVEFTIYNGTIRVEAVNSVLALSYDIRDNEVITTNLADRFGLGDYAIADLGAGTLDKAFYKAGKIDKNISTNESLSNTDQPLGTNAYIDQLLEKIANLKEFEPIKNALGDIEQGPYRNREEFVKKVIEPGIGRIIDGHEPKFTVSWARIKNVDVTSLVLEVMKQYADNAKKELDVFWYTKAISAEHFGLVGGGLLFGYYYFKDMAEYTLPDKEILKESAYITSRSYLIANYAEQASK